MERAKDSDLEELFDLVNRAYALEKGNTGVAFKNDERYRKIEHLKNDMQYYWVLRSEDGSRILGCVKAKIVTNANGVKVVEIGPFAVDPNSQGKGIGSKVLTEAEGMAEVSRIEVVSCRTDLFPYYEKRGYVEVRRHPIEEYVPDEVIIRPGLEMVVMEKS